MAPRNRFRQASKGIIDKVRKDKKNEDAAVAEIQKYTAEYISAKSNLALKAGEPKTDEKYDPAVDIKKMNDAAAKLRNLVLPETERNRVKNGNSTEEKILNARYQIYDRIQKNNPYEIKACENIINKIDIKYKTTTVAEIQKYTAEYSSAKSNLALKAGEPKTDEKYDPAVDIKKMNDAAAKLRNLVLPETERNRVKNGNSTEEKILNARYQIYDQIKTERLPIGIHSNMEQHSLHEDRMPDLPKPPQIRDMKERLHTIGAHRKEENKEENQDYSPNNP